MTRPVINGHWQTCSYLSSTLSNLLTELSNCRDKFLKRYSAFDIFCRLIYDWRQTNVFCCASLFLFVSFVILLLYCIHATIYGEIKLYIKLTNSPCFSVTLNQQWLHATRHCSLLLLKTTFQLQQLCFFSHCSHGNLTLFYILNELVVNLSNILLYTPWVKKGVALFLGITLENVDRFFHCCT